MPEQLPVDAFYEDAPKEVFEADDFIEEKSPPALPEKMIDEQAYYASALSSQDAKSAVNNFLEIKKELEASGHSDKLDQAKTVLKAGNNVDRRKAMSEILADPSLSQDVKDRSVSAFLLTSNAEVRIDDEYLKRVGSKQIDLSAAAVTQQDIASGYAMRKVRHLEDEQKQLNSIAAGFSTDVSSEIAGIGEIMLPFFEGARAETVRDAINKGDSYSLFNMFFYGEARKETRDYLNSLDIESRHQAMKKFINVAASFPGTDVGTFMSLMNLTDEGYNNVDRAIDDFFGLIDVLIIPGAIRRSVKKGQQIKKAAEMSDQIGSQLDILKEQEALIRAKYEELIPTAGNQLSRTDRINLENEYKAAKAKLDDVVKTSSASYEKAVQEQRLKSGQSPTDLPLGREAREIKLQEFKGAREAMLNAERRIDLDDVAKNASKELASLEKRLKASNESVAKLTKGLDDLNNKVKTPQQLERELYLSARAERPSAADAVRGAVPPASPLGKASAVNPYVGASQAASALSDSTGQIAKAMGTTRDQILSTFALPRNIMEKVKAVPSIFKRMEEIAEKAVDFALYSGTRGVNVYAAEKEASKSLIARMISETTEMAPIVPMSVLEDTGELYRVATTYGKTGERGFLTAKEALDTALNVFNRGDITIVRKDDVTGELKVVDKIDEIDGEYFATVNVTHVYDSKDALMFGTDIIRPSFAPQATTYIKPLESRFDSDTANMIKRAEDLASSFEKHILNDIIKKQILSKLSRKEKARVMLKVMEGSERGKTFSPDELIELSLKEQEGYYAYRMAQDILWAFTDRQFTSKLNHEGWKRVVVEGNTDNIFGRVVDDLEEAHDATNGRLYDYATGSAIELDKKTFLALKEQGKQVVEMRGVERAGRNEVFTHAIVDGVKSKVESLPKSGNLQYIDGYVQRSYKNVYFIDVMYNDLKVNGRMADDAALARHSDTVGSGESRKASEKKAKELQADMRARGENVTVIARRGDEVEDAVVKDYEVYQSKLRSTKKRGDVLMDVEGNKIDIADPLDAILREARAVGQHEAYGDLLDGIKSRFVKTYGKEIPSTQGQFPTSVSQIVKYPGRDKEYKEAVAWFQQVKQMQNTPLTSDKMWRSFAIGTAELLERIPFTRIQAGAIDADLPKAVRALRDYNPLRLMKGIAHEAFIVWHAARQLVLQPTNLMQYTLMNPKYVASGKFTKELMSLLGYGAFRGTKHDAAAVKAFSKSMGMPEKEAKVLLDDFWDKSGLVAGIDRHVFTEGVVNEAKMSAMLDPVKYAATSPIRGYQAARNLVKKAGFDMGELVNVTGSYLMARQRWMKNNPDKIGNISAKENMEEISSWARTFSGSMSRAGILGYQRGLLSVPLQFISVPHKMLFNMIPQKMGGSRFFTPREKASIAAANFTQFGAYSVGVSEAMDAWARESDIDTSTPLWIGIKGGVVDLAANAVLTNMLFGEDDGTRITMAKSFAPGSGGPFPWGDFVSNLLEKKLVDAVVGPSGAAIGRVSQSLSDLSYILKDPEDLYTTPEQTEFALKAVASWTSGATSLYKAQASYNMGKLLSSKGDIVALGKWQSAFAQALGFQTYNEIQIYRDLRKYKDEASELREEARRIHKQAVRIKRTYGQNPDEFRLRMDAVRATLSVFDDRQKSIINSYVWFLDRQAAGSTEGAVEGYLMKDAIRVLSDKDSAITRLREGLNGLPPEDAGKVREFINMGFDEEVL